MTNMHTCSVAGLALQFSLASDSPELQ